MARPRGTTPAKFSNAIGPGEHVAEGLPGEVGQRLHLIVQDVASLTEGREVPAIIILRVVVAMAGRQDHAGLPCRQDDAAKSWQPSQGTARSITPMLQIFVPPSAVAEVEHHAAMRPTASLTTSLRSPRPD